MAKILVIFLAFAATFSVGSASSWSSKLIGSNKCTWGPSYWCSDLKSSADCRMTSHCVQYWTENPYPEDDDDICKICKDMVRQARDTLRSNETQEELRQVFEGSCQLIPIKIVREECKKLADDFVPELVETLSSEMNPDTVCSVAGLCNSKRIDKLLLSMNHGGYLKSDCEICRKQSQKLSLQISNADMDLVLDKLLDMCGHMSTYSDACKVMVMENFDDIYSVLTNLDQGLCDLAGMCPSTSYALAKVNKGDVQCEFCEKVIQHWIDTWTSNTTEAEFKQVLEALCHKMKPDRVAHCLHIVDDYYIPWFNFLLHELKPKTACTFMGLCPAGIRSVVDVSPKSSISVLFKPKPSTNQLIGGYFTPQTVVEAERPSCILCEFVLRELKSLVGQNKTEAEIRAQAEKVCKIVPSSLRTGCQELIDTYGKAIFEMLARDVDPDEMCTFLKLCDPVLPPKKSEHCKMCEYVLNFLYSVLKDKNDQDEIRNVLESLCDHLPSTVSGKCDTLVDKYVEAIIDLIVKDLTPDQICEAISACKEAPKAKVNVTPVSDTKCVLCEYVMNTLETMLQNKTEEEEIRKALDKLCDYAPSQYKQQCVQFVNTYSDTIIDFLTHKISPEEVCKQLGLCVDYISNEEQFAMPENNTGMSTNNPYCMLCEYTIGEVDKLLSNKTNEDEIRSVLDRICYELSNPVVKECLHMVDKYTDMIIDMFVAEYTPEEVCMELKLCHRKYTDNNIMSNELVIEVEENKVKTGPLCVICEFAMSILEKQILTNRTMDMVERSVEMLCSYLPETVADQCTDFVDNYGDEIIHLIVEAEANPEEVCTLLTLCNEGQQWHAYAVGGTKCIFGPAFWCQSKIHAKICGTTQHCIDNVWN